MKAQPWQLDIDEYDLKLERMPLYAHLDTERHVNNVAVLGFHVEARMQLQMDILGPDSWYSDEVLLRPRGTVTQFIRQVHYGDEVTCTARLVALDDATFRLALAVFQHGECAGVQECLMGAWGGDSWTTLPPSTAAALRERLRPAVSLTPWPTTGGSRPAAWPCVSPLARRYGDLGPDRMLGELSLYRYLEESRAGPIYALLPPGFGMLIARFDVTFHRWGKQVADPQLPSGVSHVGNTSFVLRGVVEADGELLASCENFLVLYDRTRQKPVSVTDTLHDGIRSIMLPDAIGG